MQRKGTKIFLFLRYTNFLNSQRKNAIENYELEFPEDLGQELTYLREKQNGFFDEFCFVSEQHVIDLINDKESI